MHLIYSNYTQILSTPATSQCSGDFVHTYTLVPCYTTWLFDRPGIFQTLLEVYESTLPYTDLLHSSSSGAAHYGKRAQYKGLAQFDHAGHMHWFVSSPSAQMRTTEYQLYWRTLTSVMGKFLILNTVCSYTCVWIILSGNNAHERFEGYPQPTSWTPASRNATPAKERRYVILFLLLCLVAPMTRSYKILFIWPITDLSGVWEALLDHRTDSNWPEYHRCTAIEAEAVACSCFK